MSSKSSVPEISIATEGQADAPKRTRRQKAILWSVVAHLVGLSALAFWYFPRSENPPLLDQASNVPSNSQGGEGAGAGDGAVKPTPAELVPADLVKKSVEMQIDRSKELPDEEKLSQLEENLKRLSSVASEESVKDVTDKITSSLGLDASQYQPRKAAEGSFNYDTAQLDDVTRTSAKNGGWEYEATMVDADGRKTKVALSAAEGETIYNLFQKMEKYPMAAGIYRSVVMPLMQKMMEAAKATEKAAVEAKRMQQQAELSNVNDGEPSE